MGAGMNRYPKAQSVDDLGKGMKVDIYKNLHNGKWSVRDRHNGRVVAHVDECAVRNAQFIVQTAGRRRVLDERRKNVHAFVRGDLIMVSRAIDAFIGMLNPCALPSPVTYNPYKYSSFVYKDSEAPVDTAKFASLSPTGVLAYE
jgi:hypothetical protein